MRQGGTQVQGCINGYGERTGNADLASAVPDLTLKMGVRTIGRERLCRLTPVSHHIAEVVNLAPDPHQPFVGTSAFAHKAGLHTSAIARVPRRLRARRSRTRWATAPASWSARWPGRSTIALKAEQLGLEMEDSAMAEVVEQLKELEHRGYHFEVADGSLELLMRAATGWKQAFFQLESHRVITELREDGTLRHRGDRQGGRRRRPGAGHRRGQRAGQRPRRGPAQGHRPGAIPSWPSVHLTDFKVRVLDTSRGTGAVTRVLIDSTDGERTWTTIGVSENIIEASWAALADSIVYGLLHAGTDQQNHLCD